MNEKKPRKKRLAAVYTPEMRAEAYKLKLEVNKERLAEKRRKVIDERFANNDPHVKRCECGKLFDERINFKPRTPTESVHTRKFCIRCPLAPQYRIRKVWSKRKNDWIFRKEAK